MTLQFLSAIEPPEHLLEEVLARVAKARRAEARIRLASFSIIAVLSLGAFAYAASYAAHEFYASGFGVYLALMFSDRSLALAYSRDLFFSLVESLPSFAILLLGAFVGALVWSLRRAKGAARAVFLPLSLHA